MIDRPEDVPDYFLHVYDDFEFENLRWSKNDYKIFASIYNSKDKQALFCKYDLDLIQKKDAKKNNSNSDKKSEEFGYYPQEKIKLPFNLHYFVMNHYNESILLGTSENKKFLMDLRCPKNLKYFGNQREMEKIKNNEIIVEYNQENNIIFVNRHQKNIEIFDIRKEDEKVLKIEFECKVKKVEFDPFNKKEFVILFESYFVKIDFTNVKYNSYWFGEKKLNDITFNPNGKGEFLICGDTNNPENHIYPGYLNINHFPDH